MWDVTIGVRPPPRISLRVYIRAIIAILDKCDTRRSTSYKIGCLEMKFIFDRGSYAGVYAVLRRGFSFYARLFYRRE